MKKRNIRVLLMLILTVLVLPLQGICGEGRAKNIILMIGDGMGPNHMLTYYHYADRVLKNKTAFTRLMNEGTTGWMLHTPAEGLVTDSAAGATAFACGIKTVNGRLSIDRDGNPYPTLLEIAKRNGKKTGIVCNIPPWDATEAAFTAHTASRKNIDDITNWTFTYSQPDLLLGTTDTDVRQACINAKARQSGYVIVNNLRQLEENAKAAKIYGVLDVQTPYVDFPSTPDQAPAVLSQLTRDALDILSQDPDGFFVMIEGSKIDKRAHPNDAASVMREMEEFDKSIGVALDFAKIHPDTLIIVTADHETGGMAIIGGDDESLIALGKQTKALQEIKTELGDTPSPENIQAAFQKYVSVELTPEEAKTLAEHWSEADHYWGNILSRVNSVRFVSNNHTATPVVLAGYGPGSERCNGWRENIDVFDIIVSAAQMVR